MCSHWQIESPGSGFCCSLIKVELCSVQAVSSVSLTTDGYVPEDGSGCIVGIQHLPDLESVCVATGKGDVILWNTVTEQARGAVSITFS